MLYGGVHAPPAQDSEMVTSDLEEYAFSYLTDIVIATDAFEAIKFQGPEFAYRP